LTLSESWLVSLITSVINYDYIKDMGFYPNSNPNNYINTSITGNSSFNQLLTDELYYPSSNPSNFYNATTLPEQTIPNSTIIPDYFKYLSKQERENIVCGYGEENNLTIIIELGLNCIITYKINPIREKAKCNCTDI
jgi:hypothetical protein